MEKLLVIDDNVEFLSDVESLLRDRYTVTKAPSGGRGLALLESEQFSAVLLDLMMPDLHGLDVLRRIHAEIDPHLPVIIVTDVHEVDAAVEAMKYGAYDFIPKSFNLELLSAKILKALERRSLEIRVGAMASAQAEQYDRLVCVSPAMQKINFEITRLAALPFSVLIIGETGVGKDLTAFELHRRGPRRDRPFIPVAMRTFSETIIESELFGHEKGAFSGADKAKIGKLEAANGGSVYIPEVSSLSEPLQLKLLQFMQYKTISRVGQDSRKPERRLDVRIIMATNERLEDVVKSGKMREDFYHRISGVKLQLPPLRERTADIGPLAEYFLQKFVGGAEGLEFSFDPEVLDAFRGYRWPGNVRELENVIKNAIAYAAGGRLTRVDFPHLHDARPEPDPCRACLATRFAAMPHYDVVESSLKRAYFAEVLRRSGNNVTRAADVAGLTPQGFRKIMSNFDIRKD